jgi:hypothetical protein
MTPKKLENNFLVSTLGKIIGVSDKLRILSTLFYYEKLGKGNFGSFGTHYRYFHYFLWEK